MRARAPRDEQGAIAVVTAVCAAMLMVVVGLVLDYGLVRVDRQVNKSAADSATLAGLHALNGGDDRARPFRGVCAALRYLATNDRRFASLDTTTGTWTTGDGVPVVGDGCTSAPLTDQVCLGAAPTTWARFRWTGTQAGRPVSVVIQNGYATTGATGFAEDTLAAAAADNVPNPCDQLSVTITQQRQPGLGSLAQSGDLVSRVRSVGRVTSGPGGGYAPAMLLLKRTGCPVLQPGSNSGGSFIRTLGAVSTDGATQPGTIHSDSDGTGCAGSINQNVFLGRGANGIVAFAAPQATNPALADPAKPGMITSVAGSNGRPLNVQRDSAANVYASAALGSAGASAAAKIEVTGHGLVTRRPVDLRYRAMARSAMQAATAVFDAGPAGWTTFPSSVTDPCKPTQAQITALNLTPASKLYVNCTSNAGFSGAGGDLVINAGSVLFVGKLAPSGTLSLPFARKVYVGGSSADGVVLGGGGSLTMNTSTNTDSTGRCSSIRSLSKAVLFVRNGDINESNGSTLRMCKTTVFLMGGAADGCVPTVDGTAPTSAPCPGGAMGSGRINQSGGDIDWTAPDRYDAMSLASGILDPVKAAAWADVDGPEDLALWAESGSNSSSNFRMGGGGVFNVRGVFMVPNAEPFTIGGNSAMELRNAQFIATAISLNGTNTNITMSVDPNSAVPLPKLKVTGLVR